jgi:hypothetical protein
MDKLSFLGDMLSGLGGLYDGIFRYLKMFGIIMTVALIAYVINVFAALKK